MSYLIVNEALRKLHESGKIEGKTIKEIKVQHPALKSVHHNTIQRRLINGMDSIGAEYKGIPVGYNNGNRIIIWRQA